MKQVWKKRAVVVSVLLLVCAAVYLNWRYTGGVADTSKVLGQSTLVSGTQEGEDAQQTGTDGAETPAENDYFATARLLLLKLNRFLCLIFYSRTGAAMLELNLGA